jgi:hypothetical protein
VPDQSYGAVTPAASAPVTPTRAAGRLRSRPKVFVGGAGIAAALALVLMLFASAGTPVNDPIAQAATLSSSAPGYRMHLGMVMTSPVLPAPITASGSAVVDLRDHAASMTVAIDLEQIPQAAQALGSSTLQMGMVLDGYVLYMKLPRAVAAAVPGLAAKPWLKLDLAKLSGLPGLSSLSNDPTMSDPTRMLQYLRAASDSVSKEGSQIVDGLETTHYRAELSLDRLAGNLPAAERTQIQGELSKLQQVTNTHDFAVDVWIDGRHLVRRMVMNLSLHSPSGPTIDETVTADFTGYGPQPRPSIPSSDQVQDVSSLASGGLTSAGGGSTPSG